MPDTPNHKDLPPPGSMLLTIRASLNGVRMVDGAVEPAQIAGTLASIDRVHAKMGLSDDEALDAAREWVMDAMATYHPSMRAHLLCMVLWLACHSDGGASCEEAVRHGGVTLDCRFEQDGSRACLQPVAWIPTVH